jgi:biopolymer transport protein ExbB
MSFFTILMKGSWIMVAIIGCSVVAIAIFLERLMVLRKTTAGLSPFLIQMRGSLSRRDLDHALLLCERTHSPLGKIIKAGLEVTSRDRAELRETMEAAARAETHKLERNLGILGTIAAVAPLLGFLGTVTGMIKAFMKIEFLGGNVNASVLAGGIWEALVTTAAGLCVGIPALIFYNYLVSRVQNFTHELERGSDMILAILEEEASAEEEKSEVQHQE